MHAFASALLDPSLPAPAGLSAWNGSDPAARFAVYRNNVAHSLVSVLGDTFPVVRQMVGEEFFGAMARVFVADEPPRSPLMHRYGKRFADWLARFEPASALPYLPDLARLEFARLAAFHAADAAPVDPEVLARALDDHERLAATTLAMHPSLTVLRCAHPVVSLWNAHQHDDAQRDALLAGLDLATFEAAIVMRHGDDPLVIPLAPADAALAAAWAGGFALGAAQAHDPAADVTRVLTLLLTHGAVVGLSTALESPHEPLETLP
jgi:hypothetical protein